MPQPVILNLVLQTCRLQHEPFVLSLIYCVQGAESKGTLHDIQECQIRINKKARKQGYSYTCSGAPLLTLCIFPSPSI